MASVNSEFEVRIIEFRNIWTVGIFSDTQVNVFNYT